MAHVIEALFENGVFRPRERVDLTPGTVVQIELKTVKASSPRRVDLSDVEALYARLDEKYPTANVRAAYGDRSELHDR